MLLSLSVVACSNEISSEVANHATEDAPAPSAEIRFQQWSLPERLNEISGLALTADERLFAVTDEIAVVYEIDYSDGRLVKAFALGDPPVRDDFEGIAVRNGVVWLMASDGLLFAAEEGDNGENVSYQHFDTGLKRNCELEGLTVDPESQRLVMICKEKRRDDQLQIFTWNPDSGERDRIDLQEKKMEDAVDEKDVNPSGIAVDPDTSQFVVVAARQAIVMALEADGRFSSVIMRLDDKRHRQAEGIAITQDGRLLIADEAGSGRARLAIYGRDYAE